MPMISSVPKRAKCFVPIYFVSRIDTVQDFVILNLWENHNLFESHNFMIYVTGAEFSKIDRQGMFHRSHFPYMDTTVVEIYNKSQLNMICMQCPSYAVPIQDLEPSLRNLSKFWDGVHRNGLWTRTPIICLTSNVKTRAPRGWLSTLAFLY